MKIKSYLHKCNLCHKLEKLQNALVLKLKYKCENISK